MKVPRHSVEKRNTVKGDVRYRSAPENAVLTKLTSILSSFNMFLVFPHIIFPFWGITFPKKVLIRLLTYTYFQEKIFKIYIWEILNKYFSSKARKKILGSHSISKPEKTSTYKMKILLQMVLKSMDLV